MQDLAAEIQPLNLCTTVKLGYFNISTLLVFFFEVFKMLPISNVFLIWLGQKVVYAVKLSRNFNQFCD